jgi:hypothetical protein
MVLPHRLLERVDRALAAHEERNYQVREEYEVSERNQRKHIGDGTNVALLRHRGVVPFVVYVR